MLAETLANQGSKYKKYSDQDFWYNIRETIYGRERLQV